MPLVFQYGSNLSPRRLNSPRRLGGRARVVGPVVTVEHFRLDFTIWSDANDCAAADLIAGAGRPIWGALYEIPDSSVFRRDCPPGRRCLDDIENEGGSYARTPIRVRRPDGTPLGAPVITYLGKRRQAGLRTDPTYTRHILDGLRAHAIPAEYARYVYRRIAANLDPDPAVATG